MALRRAVPGVLALIVAAIAGPAILFGIQASSNKQEEPIEPRPLPVNTVPAEAVSSFRTLRGYTGTIVAARESELAFQRAGKVVEVLVDQGERVKTDQELAYLDTRHLLAQQRQQEANLREATAKLDELAAGPRKEQIAAAEAEVRNLVAQKQLQELNMKRRESLLKTSAIVQEEYDSARFGLDAIIARLYEWSLGTALARPVSGIVLAVTLPLMGFLTLPLLTEQFFPPEERNQFQIELELPAHASLNQTLERIQLARVAVMDDPEVVRADWFLGESAPSFYYNVIPTRQNTSQYAQAIVTTRSRLRSKALLRKLQGSLDATFPESRVLVRQLEQGAPFDAPVEVRLLGPDVDQLGQLGDQLRSILAETPHVLHTTADLTETMPKLALRVDEESARLAGLDNGAISRQLDATLEGAVGGSVLEGTEELPVRLRVSSRERGDLDRISSLDLVSQQAGTGSGEYVPIQALADLELLPEPAIIAHRNGSRVNEVKAYITSGILPAHVVAAFQERLKASDLELPQGYTLEYGGEAAARDGDRDGIRRIVLHSTRHVVATSLTTLAGFAPLVLWGGAFWAPLAVTIAGGVAGATLLALYFVPCAYVMMAGSRHECPKTKSQALAEVWQPRAEEVRAANAG